MNTDEAIHTLVGKGAALTMAADPGQTPVPVAWWRRIDARRHFWHAPGTSDFDHHVLRFDREEAVFDGAQVHFYGKDGKPIAVLGPIRDQEDDSGRRQQLADQIVWWRGEFDRNEYFRGNLLEAYRQRAEESP